MAAASQGPGVVQQALQTARDGGTAAAASANKFAQDHRLKERATNAAQQSWQTTKQTGAAASASANKYAQDHHLQERAAAGWQATTLRGQAAMTGLKQYTGSKMPAVDAAQAGTVAEASRYAQEQANAAALQVGQSATVGGQAALTSMNKYADARMPAFQGLAAEAAAPGASAAVASELAMYGPDKGADSQELHKYVQEGPALLSVICFVGGVVTTIVGLIGILEFGRIFTATFQYVLRFYILGCGLVAILLETDVEVLADRRIVSRLAPVVERYQFVFFRRINILTELHGRGLFYLFVGTLSASQCFICLFFLCGMWNFFIGIMCLFMSSHIDSTDGLPGHAAHPPDAAGRLPYMPVASAP